jgi:hypothetical protein
MYEQLLASQVCGVSYLTSSPPLWADCLEYVGTLTSYNPMGLYGLLQG